MIDFFLIATLLTYSLFLAKAFLTQPDFSKVKSFESMRFVSSYFLIFTVITGIIIGIIHGFIFFGWNLLSGALDFLYYMRPMPHSDYIMETYMSQITSIEFAVFYPYAYFNLKMKNNFQDAFFEDIFHKENLEFEHLNKENFEFLEYIGAIEPAFAKSFENYSGNSKGFFKQDKRYFLEAIYDDVFYFPKENLHVAEVKSKSVVEYYQSGKNGGWRKESSIIGFEGLVIIINKKDINLKEGNDINFHKIHSIQNNTQNIKTETKRKNFKHNFILKYYFNYFSYKVKKTFKVDNETNQIIRENKNIEDFEMIHPNLYKKIQEMNVDYVMETNYQLYIFHKEPGIDFFTYFSNETSNRSLLLLKSDIQFLANIIKHLKQ